MLNKPIYMDEYAFRGEHCDMVRDLTDNTTEPLFSSNVELFMFCTLVGLAYNKHSTPQKGKDTKIFLTAFSPRTKELTLIDTFVTLLGDKELVTSDERLNRTFRNNQIESNYELFESYTLGGLEYLHGKLFNGENLTFTSKVHELFKIIDDISKIEEKAGTIQLTQSDLL